MDFTSDFLHQLTLDRQQDRHASASAERLAGPAPARRRIAQSLRRAADRIDATAPPVGVGSAHPGCGTPASGVSAF
jgi:hypothetical protein